MSAEPKLMQDIVGLSHMVPPLSRRGFFMSATAATAAGYTLAAGPVRADAITTDTNGLDAGMEMAKVADGEMPVYVARPKGVQNPAVVIVCMEIFGLHEYIKDVTRRIAKLGVMAVAPDYYFRKGDLTKVTEQPKLMPLVNSKPDAELFSDLDATVAFAKAKGGNTGNLGIMGFCRGGRSVWLYSTHNPNIKAGVAFYGTLADPETEAMPKNSISLAGQVNEPVLGLYGADDAGIKPEHIEAMKAALKAANKTAEFKIFPGAPHGFMADYRPSYRKEQAEQAWADMIAWFKKYKVMT
jgi:carboxymethylenebutenolidase